TPYLFWLRGPRLSIVKHGSSGPWQSKLSHKTDERMYRLDRFNQVDSRLSRNGLSCPWISLATSRSSDAMNATRPDRPFRYYCTDMRAVMISSSAARSVRAPVAKSPLAQACSARARLAATLL